MAGGTGVVERIEPVVLPPLAFPFDRHPFAGDKLLGLDLSRKVLGDRQMLLRRGLEQRDRAGIVDRRAETLVRPGFPVVRIDLTGREEQVGQESRRAGVSPF